MLVAIFVPMLVAICIFVPYTVLAEVPGVAGVVA